MNGFKDLGITPAEFVNTVRKNLPETYRQSLPVAEAGQTDFTGIGKVLDGDENFQNIWHKGALNLVGKLLIRENKIVNPLAEFEGDLVSEGDKVVDMMMDTASTFAFNPSKAEKKLFERRPPELRSQIHTKVRDVSSMKTIQDTVVTEIFRNVSELDNYVIQVTQSLLSGNEYEKYYTTKELISTAVYEGAVRTIDLGSRVTAKQLQKMVLKVSKLMVHPNRYFNMGNVGQPDAKGNTGLNMQADFTQLRMMLPVTTSVDLNVDFFASAFHLDAVKSGLAIKEVDYFPDIYKYTTEHVVTDTDLNNGLVDEGFDVGEIIAVGKQASKEAYEYSVAKGLNDIEKVFDGSRIQAVILDRRALVINPQLVTTLTSVANQLGRYTNVILQDKEIFSWSSFMPACVILADEPTETDAVLDIQLDGETIVNNRGVASINYSAETGSAVNDVFEDGTTVSKGQKIPSEKEIAAIVDEQVARKLNERLNEKYVELVENSSVIEALKSDTEVSEVETEQSEPKKKVSKNASKKEEDNPEKEEPKK